ncbi:MAG: hypothetical protein QOG87_3299 [Actinomycetota bacterium]|jgi:NADPH:quinone reductase-like Zn-dependent oxidoreductase
MLLSPFVRQELGTFVSSENSNDLGTLRELIEADEVALAIERTFPLRATAEAIRHVQDGHARGKVVIAM